MLNENDLAQKLHDALSQKTDGKGNPTPISNQTKNYASGFIAAVKAAKFSNLPGTITGVTASGGPLSAGMGTGGLMVILPAPMIAKAAVGVPPQAVPNISKENAAIIQYVGTGLITFSTGNITGSCTSTPSSPGILEDGAGANGTIIGLTGPGAVAVVSQALGSAGPNMLAHYNALINYLLQNAVCTYAAESVVGIAPAGGGPLAAGAGTNGTIS